jgi:hypothetical protein
MGARLAPPGCDDPAPRIEFVSADVEIAFHRSDKDEHVFHLQFRMHSVDWVNRGAPEIDLRALSGEPLQEGEADDGFPGAPPRQATVPARVW